MPQIAISTSPFRREKNRADIRRSNLDGTNPRTLRSLRNVITDIAVDTAEGRLYWTGTRDKIQTMATAGGDDKVTAIVRDLSNPTDLALSNGYLYWGEALGSVRRVSLTAKQKKIENIATGLGEPRGIAIAKGRVYWVELNGGGTDAGGGKLQRANVNGTNIQELKTFSRWVPRSLAVDMFSGEAVLDERRQYRACEPLGEAF